MRKNWIFIIIYVLLIAFVTYFVSLYTEAQKSVTFLEDKKEEVINNNMDLLSATVIANKGDGTHAYIQSIPLYQESFKNDKETVEVYIYALYEVSSVNKNYSVAILLRNLNIIDDNLYKDPDNYDYTSIKADIKFNQTVSINNSSYNSFSESFTTMYDDTMKLILIDMSRITASTKLEFSSINIGYQLTNGSLSRLVALNNPTLEPLLEDKFSSDYNRNINKLNEDFINFDLNDANIYYNNELSKDFLDYNKLYIKNILWLLVVVIPLTYFIFFHKYVYVTLKNKKAIKTKQMREKIDALKEEERKK